MQCSCAVHCRGPTSLLPSDVRQLCSALPLDHSALCSCLVCMSCHVESHAGRAALLPWRPARAKVVCVCLPGCTAACVYYLAAPLAAGVLPLGPPLLQPDVHQARVRQVGSGAPLCAVLCTALCLGTELMLRLRQNMPSCLHRAAAACCGMPASWRLVAGLIAAHCWLAGHLALRSLCG